ncbi:MAG: Methyltransferase domain [Frankiales bacterium]|nr:Methyltransferase domain [Frankiales bacterium]
MTANVAPDVQPICRTHLLPSDVPTHEPVATTASDSYTQRLEALSGSRWKTLLDVQRPYRWNLRGLAPGRVLDIGCGLGRNLVHVDGNGVGVDHNARSVDAARARGLEAYLPDEFAISRHARPAAFDSLLLAHVLEHVSEATALELLRRYIGFVRPGGKVIVITPQERGFASDDTHMRFVDSAAAEAHFVEVGIEPMSHYSFPLPRPVGRVFRYNEFVTIGRVSTTAPV